MCHGFRFMAIILNGIGKELRIAVGRSSSEEWPLSENFGPRPSFGTIRASTIDASAATLEAAHIAAKGTAFLGMARSSIQYLDITGLPFRVGTDPYHLVHGVSSVARKPGRLQLQ